MSGVLFAAVTLGLLMHPGHSTRVELQYNATTQVIEMSIRIDHADLESALKKRHLRNWVLEEITDEQAQDLIGEYWRDSLRINGAKVDQSMFQWVGWDRKRASTWLYAELRLDQLTLESPDIALTILALYEVEPELNHVVAVRSTMHGGDLKSNMDKVKSMVLSKQKSTVTININD